MTFKEKIIELSNREPVGKEKIPLPGGSEFLPYHKIPLEYLKFNFYNNRIIKSKRVNLRSKLNQFAFHISNPLLVYIRNFVLKILVKNKKFLDSYLGNIYKN